MLKPVLIVMLIALILASGSYFVFKNNSSVGDNNLFLAQIFDPAKNLINNTIDLARSTFSNNGEFVEEISLYSYFLETKTVKKIQITKFQKKSKLVVLSVNQKAFCLCR
ncbi:MAG: hypothetical protein QMD50_00210 [Patescibacteria group bacterium]|nr:hypothetical protein [Patescibacteria group bacterium]